MAKQRRPRKDIVFDNGIYQVSETLLSTPRRFYPIHNTTARIRRDPLWFAVGLIFIAGLTTWTYADLLYRYELLGLWGLAGVSGLLGLRTAILHVDAAGLPNAMVFGSTATIRKIFDAIRTARARAGKPVLPGFAEE